MKTLLDALQEGRLIELPDSHKDKAIEYIATLIEAIPDINEEGISESVLARERNFNTGIGKGWACPHARTHHDGEVVCAVGWSPQGIDYGAPDGKPVHLMVMYFVPDGEKNTYLKEISSLARAINEQPTLQNLGVLTALDEVRHMLLDAISIALESTVPEAKARMIQLEAKHAEVRDMVAELPDDVAASIAPLSIIVTPGLHPIILAQNSEMVAALELHPELATELAEKGRVEHQGYYVVTRTKENYAANRVVYDCLGFRRKK